MNVITLSKKHVRSITKKVFNGRKYKDQSVRHVCESQLGLLDGMGVLTCYDCHEELDPQEYEIPQGVVVEEAPKSRKHENYAHKLEQMGRADRLNFRDIEEELMESSKGKPRSWERQRDFEAIFLAEEVDQPKKGRRNAR